MTLSDIASKLFIFFANEDGRSGKLVCRECEQCVDLKISSKSLLFISLNSVKINGTWCSHSDLSSCIHQVINDVNGLSE